MNKYPYITAEVAKRLDMCQKETATLADQLRLVLSPTSEFLTLCETATYLGQVVEMSMTIDEVSVRLTDESEYGQGEPGRFPKITLLADSVELAVAPLRLAVAQRISEFIAYELELQMGGIMRRDMNE